jgi:hypothetical protein
MGPTGRPSTTSSTVAQSRPLKIDSTLDRKMLELSITASYIQGHDITEISSADKIPPEQKRWIRQTVENLIGVEIAEEYADKVVLQNLVDVLHPVFLQVRYFFGNQAITEAKLPPTGLNHEQASHAWQGLAPFSPAAIVSANGPDSTWRGHSRFANKRTRLSGPGVRLWHARPEHIASSFCCVRER